MKSLFFLLLLASSVFASQYVTVTNRPVGIQQGNPNGQVKIELVYDPTCDDTYFFHSKFSAVWQFLSSQVKQKISVRYISLSLPYHIYSQKLTQAIIYVQQKIGNDQAFLLLQDFLQNRQDYSQPTANSISINGVLNNIGDKVNKLFGLKKDLVLKELLHGSNYDSKTRSWSKYAMGEARVSGTPTMRVNGVTLNGGTNLSANELADLLRKLAQN